MIKTDKIQNMIIKDWKMGMYPEKKMIEYKKH